VSTFSGRNEVVGVIRCVIPRCRNVEMVSHDVIMTLSALTLLTVVLLAGVTSASPGTSIHGL